MNPMLMQDLAASTAAGRRREAEEARAAARVARRARAAFRGRRAASQACVRSTSGGLTAPR